MHDREPFADLLFMTDDAYSDQTFSGNLQRTRIAT